MHGTSQVSGRLNVPALGAGVGVLFAAQTPDPSQCVCTTVLLFTWSLTSTPHPLYCRGSQGVTAEKERKSLEEMRAQVPTLLLFARGAAQSALSKDECVALLRHPCLQSLQGFL